MLEKKKGDLYKRIDFNIIATVIFIVAFGILILFSSSREDALLKEQIMFVIVGFGIMLTIQFFDYKLLKKVASWGYAASVFFLLLLLLPGLKVSSHGATRWIRIAGITIQIAEVVKFLMIIYLAYLLSKYILALRRPINVLKVWGFVGVIAFMILKISSNLSSCLILLMITFCLTYVASDVQWLHYLSLTIIITLTVILCMYLLANLPTQDELEMIEKESYQLARIIAWLAPEKYNSDHSFQILQGLYAIGSGGFFGRGLGKSMQRDMLPEATNDMILCILAEELGVLGVLLLVILYLFLFYQILIVAINAKTVFGRLLCAGIMLHFVFQALVNMAVATSVIPNTGVTLPFVSAGGSAMLLYFLQVGIVLSVYRRDML